MVADYPKWLSRVWSHGAALGRLFCFPFAGGSSSIYRGWQALLGNSIELCPVHLPGRGIRLAEAPITDLRQMIEALAKGLAPYLHVPFAFFGHSMGALLAYELTLHLREINAPTPYLIGVSARQAPHVPIDSRRASHTSDEEFLALLGELSGGTLALLGEPSLRKIHLPILRADFLLCESVRPKLPSPLDIPIVAFSGARDATVSYAMIDQWRAHTRSRFVMKVMAGDHFFVNQCGAEICAALSKELLIGSMGGARGYSMRSS